jgi:hypothetical protein
MTLNALRPFVLPKRARGPRPACDICASPIGERHVHVFDGASRSLLCSCASCGVLFKAPGAGGGRLRTVLDRVLFDPHARSDDAAWAALAVPVQLAFLAFDSGDTRWTVTYPSPAGPVRADVPTPAWEAFAIHVPLVRHVQADIEALVVRAERGRERECFVAPIDACYGLVGAIRARWTGIHGGEGVRAAIDDFFAGLRAKASAAASAEAGAS